ncbi:MAG: hypothetical protein KGI38_02365 [Thaumarchaeota archaeon]|nr:hypothetical protein [Nitrososphaerota archaeon]
MAIYAEAKNGGWRSLSPSYWTWIRHIATEEGLALPQSGSETETLSADEAKKLAVALKVRADKIRKGLALRDADSYLESWYEARTPPAIWEGKGNLHTIGYDEPNEMDKTADFFDLSGGVTFTY